MAHTVRTFANGISKILNKEVDVDTDTLKAALMTSGYVPDYQLHDFMDDATIQEVNYNNGDTNGYFAGFGGTGRQTLANVLRRITSTHVEIDADDLTFPALGAALPDVHGILIYAHKTTDADSPLICYVDFSPIHDPDGNALIVQFNPNGMFRYGY